MTKPCIVPNCKTGLKSLQVKKSVFKVPKDETLSKAWRCAIPGNQIMKNVFYVCEDHFEQRFLRRSWVKRDENNHIICEHKYQRVYLEPGAVPTIFGELRQIGTESSMAEPEVTTGLVDEIVKEEEWLGNVEGTSSSSFTLSTNEVDPSVHVKAEIKEEAESEEEEQLAPFEFVSVPAIKTEEVDEPEDPLSCGEQVADDEEESHDAYEEHNNFGDFSGNPGEESSFQAVKGNSLKSKKIYTGKYSGEKQFMCDTCNKIFLLKSSWERHKLLHKMKPFQCDVCERSYENSLALSIHKRIHTEAKPYICQVCGAEYSRAQSLSKHKLMHRDLIPFSCDVSGKSFMQKYNLKIHKQVHTVEKPFQCLVCSESFRAKEKLIIHQRKHTGEKPYECNVCGKAFSILTSYKVHMKTHDSNRQ